MNILKKAIVAALIGGSFTSQVHAAPIVVGVVYGGRATGIELVAQLNNDTFIDFSATGLNASGADTFAELSIFDVIILGDSGYRDNGYTASMFASLRSFMDQGGGIVTTGWYNYATDPYSGQQAIDADFITPIDDSLGGYNYANVGSTLDIFATPHDITVGISDFTITSNNIEYETGIDGNATQLGAVLGNSSAVTIAYQEIFGRSVYLGGQYLASTSYNNASLRSGVEDQLLEQAVAWAGNVNEVPEPGSLALICLGLVGFSTSRKKAAD